MIRLAARPSTALLTSATLLLALGMSSNALAQDTAVEAEASTGISDMGDDDEDIELEDTHPGQEAAPAEEPGPGVEAEAPAESEAVHRDGSTQLLVGARYRMLITPKWLINMFGVDGGRSLILHGVGPEVGGYWGDKSNGFMGMLSIWHVGYGMEATPFKGKNDGNDAWEIIESDLKVWYLTVDAMWDHKLVDTLSANVGLGAGIGFVNGYKNENGVRTSRLSRYEAYQDNSGNAQIPADSNMGWPALSKCVGPNNPNSVECPADGNYGDGKPWPVYPWLNFQAGLRYQPVDEFIARLDLGLGSSGFWIGLGADYAHFL